MRWMLDHVLSDLLLPATFYSVISGLILSYSAAEIPGFQQSFRANTSDPTHVWVIRD
jgi:hypothetical protein